MSPQRTLLLVLVLAGCSAGGGAGGSGGAGGTPHGSLAGGVRITEISVDQGVEIPVMQNGGPVSKRNAPVVQGRPAIVRVFVTPDAGFQARTILARLSLTGQADQTVSQPVPGPSSEGDIASTFDFNVPAAQLTASTQLAVDLEEVGGAPSNGDTGGARWPAGGAADLGAESANGPIKVVVVPVVMNGITPDTGAQRAQALRDALLDMYPVTDVSLTIVNPVSYPNGSVSPNGSGWAEALQWAMSLRNPLNVDSKTFIYGMLAPASSILGYCGGGCVAGLGSVPSPGDVSQRAAIGLGYFPDGSGGPSQFNGGAPITLAHELGHALGRSHSPCAPPGAQLTGVDPAYPYPGGSIGSWGWDLLGKKLADPAVVKDVMGYCQPVWISDYTYAGIFDREAFVNSHAMMLPAADPARAPGVFRVAIIEPDGTMHWSGSQRFDAPQYGEARGVDLVAADGRITGKAVGFFTPVADLPGGILYVRQEALPAGTGAIRAPSLSSTVLHLP